MAVTNLNEHAREVIFTADRQYLAVKQDWVNNPSWYESCLGDGANIPVEQWAAYRTDAIKNCASALNARQTNVINSVQNNYCGRKKNANMAGDTKCLNRTRA